MREAQTQLSPIGAGKEGVGHIADIYAMDK